MLILTISNIQGTHKIHVQSVAGVSEQSLGHLGRTGRWGEDNGTVEMACKSYGLVQEKRFLP